MSANDTRGSQPKQILKEISMQMYRKGEFRPTSLNLAANRKARNDKRSCGRHVQIAAETWSVFGSVSFVALRRYQQTQLLYLWNSIGDALLSGGDNAQTLVACHYTRSIQIRQPHEAF